MHKPNQNGFSHILVLIIIVLIIVAVGAFVFSRMQSNYVNVVASLPICQSQSVFSASPLSSGDLAFILPRGNVNPPDHTLPSNHIYLTLLSTRQNAKQVPVYSPGNITITSVRVAHYSNASGQSINGDYSIYSYPCRTIQGYFGHMSTLSSAIESKLGHVSCYKYGLNNGYISSVQQCDYSVDIPLAAGVQIGTAGGPSSAPAMDFGVVDQAVTLPFISPRRYNSQTLHSACPIDYFTPNVKTALQVYLGEGSSQRTAPPICGQVNQDVTNTLQGNWFYGSSTKDGPGNWLKELAIVHNNANPALDEISIGGVISQAKFWTFSPLSSGLINHEPSGVHQAKRFIVTTQTTII